MVVQTALPQSLIDAAQSASPGADRRWDYYNTGTTGSARLGVGVPPELRYLQVAFNACRVAVDAKEERIDVSSFVLPGQAQPEGRLWEWWQANNMGENAHLAHLEALVNKRCFVVVGAGEDPAVPLFTVHSARNMSVRTDPATGKVLTALQLWLADTDDPAELAQPNAATLFGPNQNTDYVSTTGGWEVADVRQHNLGIVPVVPMINRAALRDTRGKSEMDDVIPLVDATMRTLTNMQVAQEFLALPQRFILGADEDELLGTDTEGNRKSAFQAYINRYFVHPDQDVTVGQLPAADLRNFIEVVSNNVRLMSSVTGIPPHYFGISTDNPASADAIRNSEQRLITRIRRLSRSFGNTWEQVMRIAVKLIDGDVPSEYQRLQTTFVSPETPTEASQADAVQKMTGGKPIMSTELAMQRMGLSESEKDINRKGLAQEDGYSRLADSLNRAQGDGVDQAIPAD